MNRRQKPPKRRPLNPVYRPAFERLDEAWEENTQSDNSETTRLLRLGMFGDVDELEESGTVKLPE